MAVKINGKKVSVGVASKHATLPLCGVYIAKTKANDAYTMYLDHYTSMEKVHRAYKQVYIHTKDPETSFGRLCKAFKVALPSSITQKAAAELLAASMAEYGALKCVRTGKQQEWLDIHPVHLDVNALPWGHPAKEGMVLESLWNPPEEGVDLEGCDCTDRYSIAGKTLEDVISDINSMGGMPTDTLAAALESVDVMDADVDFQCYSKLSDLLRRAREQDIKIIRLKKQEEVAHV